MTNQIKATYVDHMGSDLSVVNSARVSFGKQSGWSNEGEEDWHSPFIGEVRHELRHPDFVGKLGEADTKLIKYLAKHKHISPFGHAFASFHVKAPVFVARQLVKHKFLRWNEISRRYVDNPPEFYTPDVWRGKSADKKQGSSGVCQPPLWLDSTMNQVLDLYDQMIHDGCAPEQARMVLPQSMMTEWYWSGSLDAFADMCRLRTSGDTQAETQEVAWQIYREMDKLFPVAWDALMENLY